MTRKEIINIFIYTGTGFTIVHGLLSFLIVTNRQVYNQVLYHYSDNLTWYVIFFLFPLLAGLIFYFFLKNKHVSKRFRILFGSILTLQIAFTITASIINYNYWGYAFIRPTVFREIHNADKVLNCTRVSNVDSTGMKPLHSIIDTSRPFDTLYGRKDIYYGNTDRPFMAFQDKADINIHLHDFPDIYNNPSKKSSKTIIQNIETQILEAKIIDKGQKGYDRYRQLHGILTEFITSDSIKYIIVGLRGNEVSNDHYPFYEFLFVEKNSNYKLIKEQRYYIDIAGIEGLEYSNFATFFSIMLTITGFIAAIIIETINRIMKRRNKNKGLQLRNNTL